MALDYSIKFVMSGDDIIRSSEGEEMEIKSLENKRFIPIWGILVIQDDIDNTLTVKQLTQGEISVVSVRKSRICTNITLSRHMESNGWDTEYSLGEGNSLATRIWTESPWHTYNSYFKIQAKWNENGGFSFLGKDKKYNLEYTQETEVYSVTFYCDISKIIKDIPNFKWVYPCIPFVHSGEGQSRDSYTVHYFDGQQGELDTTMK